MTPPSSPAPRAPMEPANEVLSDNAQKFGYVMLVLGRAWSDWKHGDFPWWFALLLWAVTSVVGLAVWRLVSWMFRKWDAWFALRRAR